ncbi:MAG: hypothetical protein EBV03_07925 [Proteobacteria bacterium]|nr:hypothetical protein [Pseudomonadota bacterium]
MVMKTVKTGHISARSFAEAVLDRRREAQSPLIRAQREVVQQLDAMQPDEAVLEKNLHMVLAAGGSDAVFTRDDYTRISIADALEANKARPAAKKAVTFAAKEIRAQMAHEHKAEREQAKKLRDSLREESVQRR